jgi:acetylornithine deacetylase
MELLEKTLQKNKEKYIGRLLKLVERDTHDIGHGIEGGLEAAGQEYLIGVLREIGADEIIKDPLKEEIIQKSRALYREGNPGHNYDNRYNVYATFKGAGGKSILFNGHIDHMPADNEAAWTTPPLKPRVRDGKIVGLGVCDMKAGLMAPAAAVELLFDAGIAFPAM